MSFFSEFDPQYARTLSLLSQTARAEDVERVLKHGQAKSIEDFAALISPAADAYLEKMAALSSAATLRNFGRTIRMFVPLYVSNICVNNCLYCGFARRHNIERKTLSLAEVEAEVKATHDMGFRSILIVAGESPQLISSGYLEDCIKICAKKYPSISVEIAPSPADVYARFTKIGCEGLTVFQETYDTELYKVMHPSGPKSNFEWRLGTPERAAEGGMRSLGLGPLFGLGDWRFEIIACAMHAKFLYKNANKCRVNISLPRMRPAESGFKPKEGHVPTDSELVKILCALRLFMQHLGLVVSTREPRYLRDGLVGLGVTQMSAASSTKPGGYAEPESAGSQFDIDDDRSVQEFSQMIISKGYEPVWKDFDLGFVQ
jgi:2-iminoacetate synthase